MTARGWLLVALLVLALLVAAASSLGDPCEGMTGARLDRCERLWAP